MLKVLPNIKTLRLSSYNFTPILLEEMRSNLHLCPSLTDVTFIWMCSLTDDDLCLLVDMLYARAVCTTRATIKRIVLEDEVIIYAYRHPKPGGMIYAMMDWKSWKMRVVILNTLFSVTLIATMSMLRYLELSSDLYHLLSVIIQVK